ncbi:MAG: cob(I)yrinic acid a,c-diamide adenosyltransferase [Gammaproteobacteria bacterium]|nr:cob(I)yrinic acid a,c-diamide adenosyltransferase [Gammaproteobacteria bacterium]
MSPEPSREEIAHAARMQRKKGIIDAAMERANIDRGVLLVHSGNGKGKSSAAFGMAVRALGHGMKVGVVQFIKGKIATGEEQFFRRFPDEISFHVMGEGFTWDTQDKSRDIANATAGWDIAATMLQDESLGLVILDELNIVLHYHYLPLEPILAAIKERPKMQHLVITGRGAPEPLIEIADTVTSMTEVKHAYRAGIRAQRGVEL